MYVCAPHHTHTKGTPLNLDSWTIREYINALPIVLDTSDFLPDKSFPSSSGLIKSQFYFGIYPLREAQGSIFCNLNHLMYQ